MDFRSANPNQAISTKIRELVAAGADPLGLRSGYQVRLRRADLRSAPPRAIGYLNKP